MTDKPDTESGLKRTQSPMNRQFNLKKKRGRQRQCDREAVPLCSRYLGVETVTPSFNK